MQSASINKKHFGLVWQICLLIVSLFSFQIALFAERLPVKIYTSADGLGSSFVDCVYRDSRSFMWFCTRDGLSRFDGSRFVTYQIGEKDFPPGIEAIEETPDGYFWATTTGGIYRFDPDKNPNPETSNLYLNAEFIIAGGGRFYKDRNGILWLLSGGGLSRLKTDGEKPKFEDVKLNIPQVGNKPFSIFDLDETDDGSLWIATSWGLVRRLPDERLVVYPFEMTFILGNSAMRADKGGHIWLSVTGKIFVIKSEPLESFANGESLIIKSVMPTSRIVLEAEKSVPMPQKDGEIYQFNNKDFIDKWTTFRMFETSDSTFWITVEDNLLEFANGVLHVHTRNEGLPNDLKRMGEDAAGNLWISGAAGLARLDRNGLVSFGLNDGMSSEIFASINEDSEGKMYFAARGFYLNKFDGQKFQAVRPQIDANSSPMWTSRYAFLASNGDWWILTDGKLYRFSGVKDFAELNSKAPTKIYTAADGLNSDGMFQIFEDSAGNIWVSTRGNSGAIPGLSRLKKGEERFHAFSAAENYPPNKSPSSFAEDFRGNIWFGFYQGGLARFDGERFETFDENNGLPPRGVLSDLHLDLKGRLWISSSNKGLLRLDDTSTQTPSFVNLTVNEGLSSNNVRTIIEDKFGRIYAGTASGVDRISPDSMQIKHFSVNDGLAADFVVDSHLDKRGNLWFATNSGISRLVPLPDEKMSAPPVFIGNLRISGIPQTVSNLGAAEIEKGDLTHTENNFEIEFFGLDYRAGETLRYQYKLEGADKDWSAPTEQRKVTYPNLSSGNYRFLVRAVNSEGSVSVNPATISFQILPPIYLRWWFIALSVLALLAVSYAFYYNRLTRLEAARLSEEKLRKAKEERLAELEKVRSRIATDLHDDIGASLTQIAILSEVAQTQSKGNGASEPLKMIYNVSNELVGTMSDIVWAINPTKDHLHDLTLRMRRFASDVLTAKEIDFEFETPENETEISLNSNLRREVFLIFKETINNIVKHSEATEVKIDFDISEKELSLAITDNGIGFETEKIAENSAANLFADYIGGNGLISIRRRVSELGGELEIISKLKQGTKIEFVLPLQKIQ